MIGTVRFIMGLIEHSLGCSVWFFIQVFNFLGHINVYEDRKHSRTVTLDMCGGMNPFYLFYYKQKKKKKREKKMGSIMYQWHF